MFANILEIESAVVKDISSKFLEIGLDKGWCSLHNIYIDLIDTEIEISGFNKKKGEEFTIFYNFQSKQGKIHYLNGEINWFKC